MNELFPKSSQLTELGRRLGQHPARIALWNEGAVAARLHDDKIIVSRAGAHLAHLDPDDLLEIDLPRLLPLLDNEAASDAEVETLVLGEDQAGQPSADTFSFGWLLAYEGVRFVAHTQPIAVNQITCSPRARQFADRRNLPHEIIICGQASVLVPFAPPGLALAREIRRRIALWQDRYKETPKVILIQNHGMFVLGESMEEVIMITELTIKYAEIFIGAAMMGGPEFMKPTFVTKLAAGGAL